MGWTHLAVPALTIAALALGAPQVAAQKKEEPKAKSAKPMSKAAQRGKYLVEIGSCNDCHTPGFAETEGKVPEKDWLTGDVLGWRGPWGTTYPSNLRLVVQNMTTAQFLARSRGALRPPMPVPAMRAMSDADVKAIYAYLKYLGPAGSPAPAYVPPDKTPSGPYVQFPAPPPTKK
jgi:mono/diheme cytochrome c family protein